jgi:hypothetical protein
MLLVMYGFLYGISETQGRHCPVLQGICRAYIWGETNQVYRRAELNEEALPEAGNCKQSTVDSVTKGAKLSDSKRHVIGIESIKCFEV